MEAQAVTFASTRSQGGASQERTKFWLRHNIACQEAGTQSDTIQISGCLSARKGHSIATGLSSQQELGRMRPPAAYGRRHTRATFGVLLG